VDLGRVSSPGVLVKLLGINGAVVVVGHGHQPRGSDRDDPP
jgi:hypothetical protein